MAKPKRKNKPGAGGPRQDSGRKPAGRTHRINSFRVVPEVGMEFDAAARAEGAGPLLERLWREHHPKES